MVTAEQTPRTMVYALLAEYGGSNSFLLSLKEQRDKGWKLSPKQIDGAIRALTRDMDAQAERQRLWRETVKTAHPDHARDDGDRYWRNRFTVMANRAYEAEDIAALVWLHALVVRPLT